MSFSEPPVRRASNEAARVLAVRNLQILDTLPEQAFDDIVNVAATICAAPISLVSLVDHDRQWFKSRLGVEAEETSRDVSFCSVAIEHDDAVFEVPDTLEDERFRENPDVTGGPHYRFYAGVPLRVRGHAIGTLCVLDVVPRALTSDQRDGLIALARGVTTTIEYRHLALVSEQAGRTLARDHRDAAVFATAVAHARDGIMILGTDEATGEASRITYVNAAFSKMMGRDFTKLIGHSIREVALQSSNQEKIDRLFVSVREGVFAPIPLSVRIGNGTLLSLEMTLSPLPEQSVDARTVIVFRDVTEREAHAARAERTAQTGSWTHDLSSGRLTFSSESHRMFGVDAGDSRPEPFRRRIVAEDRERVSAEIRTAYESGDARTFEYRIVVAQEPRFIRESVEVTRDARGFALRADGIFVDITARRTAELSAFRHAYTDDITGLPNRSALRARIERERGEGGDASHAFLLVNIDRFRSKNDDLGRETGDALLRAAGERVRANAPNAYVARVENDTFGALLEPGCEPESVAARVHEAFRAPFEIGDGDIVLSVSIGIATIDAGDSASDIAHKAEVAVHSARAAGGNRTVAFDRSIEAARSRAIALGRDLHKAVERREFALHYQPIVGTASEVVTIEALLRWTHPTYGNVPPDEFVPLAEENGTILEIGRYVLRTACAQAQRFRLETGLPLRVAVNVSAKQFADTDLLRVVEESLASSGLPARALEIEITESTIAHDPKQASGILDELRLAGVTISVDDFGTGYSSLANLRHFPLDNLKIDRSFVARTPENADDCAIVEAIIGLAAQLSLHVVAEGVETHEQATYLRRRGCAMLQGYLFSRPLVADAVVHYVLENRRFNRGRRHA